MLKVAICGGSGYTGGELIRLLSNHPYVKITAVTSEKSSGKTVSDLFPHLSNHSNLTYEPLDREKLLKKADIFFWHCLMPPRRARWIFFFRHWKKVVDLSADYRLRSAEIYEEWYKTPHKFHGTLKRAVYGLPELYRAKIAKSSLIANPGCYPTGAILGLYPAMKTRLIDADSIVIDSASGTTGAGRNADAAFSFCEINEGFKAYSVASHRHTPEIEQELSAIAHKDVRVNFTPHLGPYDRGILTTIYAKLKRRLIQEQFLMLIKRFLQKSRL